MKHISILSIMIFLWSTAAFAHRPLFTEDFTTLDFGKYELELSYNRDVPRLGTSPYSLLNALLKVGIMPKTDFWITVPYFVGGLWGVGDTVVRGKYQLQQWGAKEGVAARLDIKLSTGDSTTGTGNQINDFAFMLVCSKKLGAVLSHLNFGYTAIGAPPGATPTRALDYRGALEYAVGSPDKKLVCEILGHIPQDINTLNLQLGGNMKIRQNITLDAGYLFALNNVSVDTFNLGCTIDF